MALSTSFTNTGATPKASILTPQKSATPFTSGATASPFSSALSKAQSPAPIVSAKQSPYVAPSTPVKKETVMNTDGSSKTTEYHPPEKTAGLLEKAPVGSNANTEIPEVNANRDLQLQGLQNNPGGTPLTPEQTQNQSQQQQQNTQNTTYPGLIGSIVNRAQNGSPQANDAYQRAQEINKEIADSKINQARTNKAIYSKPQVLGIGVGRAKIAQDQYLAQQNALASELQGQSTLYNAGVTANGQAITGLTSAAGAAAPVQLPYSNQYIDPTTGQPVGGGSLGSLDNAVSTIVQRISSGQMSYDQGVQALGGYGQGGVNALQQALGPNFNVAQSNALAGQQGTISPALDYARVALNNLKDTLGGLKIPGQNSNIPLVGGIASGISSQLGIGSQETAAKNNAIAEARNAIQKVLASVQGGTPTDYTGQSHTLLPDNATPQQIDAAINTLETLGTAKQSIYGNPGNATSNNTSNGNQPKGWL